MTGSQKALALSFLAGVAAVLWYHLLVFQAVGGTTSHFGFILLWLFPYLPLSVLLLSSPEGLDGFLEFIVPVIQIIVLVSIDAVALTLREGLAPLASNDPIVGTTALLLD